MSTLLGLLQYKLCVEEAKRIDNIKDKESKKAMLANLENIKKVMEEIIKGYTKESYEAENEKHAFGTTGNRKEIIKRCDVPVAMPNLKAFLETYSNEGATLQNPVIEKAKQKVKEDEARLKEEMKKNENKPIASRTESDSEVIARIGNGSYASGRTDGTITLREAHQNGYINLDDYRKRG